MDQPQQVPINIADLVRLRKELDDIMQPGQELSDAIINFEKEIAKALNSFKVNTIEPASTPTKES